MWRVASSRSILYVCPKQGYSKNGATMAFFAISRQVRRIVNSRKRLRDLACARWQ